MSENIIQNSITTALMVADLVEKLSTGTVETAEDADERLKTTSIPQRRTYVTRNVQHLKRVMSQEWFAQALTIEQFNTINSAIVAGEDYLG